MKIEIICYKNVLKCEFILELLIKLQMRCFYRMSSIIYTFPRSLSHVCVWLKIGFPELYSKKEYLSFLAYF